MSAPLLPVELETIATRAEAATLGPIPPWGYDAEASTAGPGQALGALFRRGLDVEESEARS